jgi:hypothetical protein
MFLGSAFGIGMIRPARRVELWAAATSWLIAHAAFHLWEVAVGIRAPSVTAARELGSGYTLEMMNVENSRRKFNVPLGVEAQGFCVL